MAEISFGGFVWILLSGISEKNPLYHVECKKQYIGNRILKPVNCSTSILKQCNWHVYAQLLTNHLFHWILTYGNTMISEGRVAGALASHSRSTFGKDYFRKICCIVLFFLSFFSLTQNILLFHEGVKTFIICPFFFCFSICKSKAPMNSAYFAFHYNYVSCNLSSWKTLPD